MPSDPEPASPSLRFGDELELDRSAYQLRRAGHPVKLERIPLEILLLLTERPGQLVTREQIAERVWGMDAALDVDNSINGAVRKIRHALKDDPEQPRFIQTITGRGYRFVAPVLGSPDPVAEPAKATPTEPVTSPHAGVLRRPLRASLWLGGGLALALAVAGLVWAREWTSDRTSGRAMLAVLPFQNLTGDDRQGYFSDGLTEEMIAQIGNRAPAQLGVIYADHGMVDSALAEAERWRPVLPASVH